MLEDTVVYMIDLAGVEADNLVEVRSRIEACERHGAGIALVPVV